MEDERSPERDLLAPTDWTVSVSLSVTQRVVQIPRAFHVAVVADSAPRPTCAHCFYARDAVLARVLAMALCLPVCLSVTQKSTNRCSVETDEPIELAFGLEASFDQSYTALQGN